LAITAGATALTGFELLAGLLAETFGAALGACFGCFTGGGLGAAGADLLEDLLSVNTSLSAGFGTSFLGAGVFLTGADFTFGETAFLGGDGTLTGFLAGDFATFFGDGEGAPLNDFAGDFLAGEGDGIFLAGEGEGCLLVDLAGEGDGALALTGEIDLRTDRFFSGDCAFGGSGTSGKASMIDSDGSACCSWMM
jgi:hypothetical protein